MNEYHKISDFDYLKLSMSIEIVHENKKYMQFEITEV